MGNTVRLFQLFFILTGFLFFAPLAKADTVFLIQLGSFETEEQADTTWKMLKEEYEKLLSPLSHQASEIALPIAGAKPFRLQAGPITNRQDAQRICSTLTQEQEECFVVETAMFTGDAPAPVQIAKTETPQAETPAIPAIEEAAVEEVAAEIVEKIEEPQAIAAPELESSELSAADVLIEAVEVEDVANAAVASAAALETVTPSTAPVAEGTGIFDSITQAVIAPFLTSSDTEETEETRETAEAEMTDASEGEIEEKVETEIIEPIEAVTSTAITEAGESTVIEAVAANEERPTLPWARDRRRTRIFSTYEAGSENVNREEARTAAAEPIAETAVNATPDTTQQDNLPVIAKPNVKIEPIEAVVERAVTAEQEAAQKVAKQALQQAPLARTAKPSIIIQPLPGVNRAAIQKRAAQASMVERIAREASANNGGEVTVAEAIPVPLSDLDEDFGVAPQWGNQQQKGAATVNSGLPVFNRKRALGWKGTPSQNFLQKSFWAKLGYFDDEAKTRNYWNQLQKKYPRETQGLRMRITRPYGKRTASKRSSMQLGPLSSYQEVKRLCQLFASTDLTCEIRRTSGVTTPETRRGDSSTDRYQNRRNIQDRNTNRTRGNAGKFWVQLGSYSTRGAAMKFWSELNRKHLALKSKHPHLAHPPYSSAEKTIYRLRTGPFATRVAARQLCDMLTAQEASCIVVRN